MHIKQTHIADTRPNLLKEHDFSTRDQQKKFSTLKGQIIKMNKHQAVTKCINHWADSANFKVITFNKKCSGLTVKCFEMPNASYTRPLAVI